MRPGSSLAHLGAVLVLALALGFAAFRAGSTGRLAELRLGASEWVMVDFRTVVYYPAKAFADGINPYDAEAYRERYPAKLPFRGYPPATLLVHQPFAWLSLPAAMRLQAGLTLALTAFLAWASLKLSGIRPSLMLATLSTGIILLSRPGHWNLMLGQVTLVPVLATYVVFAVSERRYLVAGLALAVTTLKPTYAVPLAILMLVRGQLAAVAVGVAVSGVVNLSVLAALAERSGGLGRALSLIGGVALPDPSDIHSQYSVFRIDAIAMVSRFAGHQLHLALAFVISAGVLGITAYGLRRRLQSAGRDPAAGVPDPVAAGLAMTGLLFSVYHVSYDLLLLVWPATALAGGLARPGAAGPWTRIQLVLVVVLACNYLGTFAVLEAVGLRSPWTLWLASLNSLVLFALFAMYARAATDSSLPGGRLPVS